MENTPLEIIKKKYTEFHPKEKDIADKILSSPDNVIHKSIKEFSAECDSAESSIVRFCKLLGYSGFPELKLELAKASSAYTNVMNVLAPQSEQDITSSTSTINLINNTCMLLEKCKKELDFSLLDNAADIISKSKLFLIYGYLYSGTIAQTFTRRMVDMGIPAFLACDLISMKQNSLLAGSDTVSLFISHSGNNHYTLNSATQAKENGSKIIAITSDETSPLAELSDIAICLPVSGDQLFTMYYPTEFAFQLILASIENKLSKNNTDSERMARTKMLKLELIENALDTK